MIANSSASISSLVSLFCPSMRIISPCLRRIGGSVTRRWRSEAPSLTSVRSSVSMASLFFSRSCAEILTLLRDTGFAAASSGGRFTDAKMPVRRAKSPFWSTTHDTFHLPPWIIARIAKTPSGPEYWNFVGTFASRFCAACGEATSLSSAITCGPVSDLVTDFSCPSALSEAPSSSLRRSSSARLEIIALSRRSSWDMSYREARGVRRVMEREGSGENLMGMAEGMRALRRAFLERLPFDLNRGVMDVLGGERPGHLLERDLVVRGVAHDGVRAHRDDARGQRPDVQVVHRPDVVDRLERPPQRGDVDVGRRGLEEHVHAFPHERPAAANDEQRHHDGGQRIGERPSSEPDQQRRDDGSARPEQVAEHAQV